MGRYGLHPKDPAEAGNLEATLPEEHFQWQEKDNEQWADYNPHGLYLRL
jgi:hypothetical protein